MALPTTTAMMTNEEVVATATEASKLVLMNSTTTSQDEDDSDDLDVNVDKKKKYLKLKVAAAVSAAAAAAAAASILVMGGTTLFSSVEINTLRTSTTSNTAEGTTSTSTTTNVDGCCNVATGSFDQGSLQDCYTTDCGFLDSGCADEIYCWSNKRFNSDGDSEGCEPQGDFSTVDPGDIYENYCGNPCGTFASHTC